MSSLDVALSNSDGIETIQQDKKENLETAGVSSTGSQNKREMKDDDSSATHKKTKRKAPIPKTFKILLVGAPGVGKTAMVKRHKTGEFIRKYKPDTFFRKTGLDFHTNRGPVKLETWDFSGDIRFSNFNYGGYSKADGAIIMFSLTDKYRYSRRAVNHFYKDIRSQCANIPIVLVGNKNDKKCDVYNQYNFNNIYNKRCVAYYPMCVKNNYNFEKPFLCLIRKICQDPTLDFVAPPFLAPVELQLSPQQVKQLEHEVKICASIPMPADESEEEGVE